MRNCHVLGSKQHKGIGEPWRLFSHVEKGLPASDARWSNPSCAQGSSDAFVVRARRSDLPTPTQTATHWYELANGVNQRQNPRQALPVVASRH